MPPAKHSRRDVVAVERLRTPKDYFAETRSSLELWPEKILCFTRKTAMESDSQPLARYHHHRYVLVVNWMNSGEVYVDERRFLLQSDDGLLIFPFQFHHGFKFRRPSVLWQFITFEIKDGSALEALRLSPHRRFQRRDFELLSNLVQAWNRSGDQDELAPWLALILNRMLRAPRAVKERWDPELKISGSFLVKINKHCLARLHQPFGLKELAGWLSMSESHLRASFRRTTGMSLGQHLRRLRLQKAMGMLVQSNLNVTQIAEKCGFDSVFAFSRSFRRFTGITASEYRTHSALS